MRLRLALWGSLLMLQLLVTASPPEAMAPTVAGSIYLPLTFFWQLGLPVFTTAESGGWAAPSLLGWVVVAAFWAVWWWSAASLVSYLVRRRIDNV